MFNGSPEGLMTWRERLACPLDKDATCFGSRSRRRRRRRELRMTCFSFRRNVGPEFFDDVHGGFAEVAETYVRESKGRAAIFLR